MNIPNYTGHSPESNATEATLTKISQLFARSFSKAVNSDEQKEYLNDFCLKFKKALKSRDHQVRPEMTKKIFEFAKLVWLQDQHLTIEDFKKIWKSHLPLP